ncbi:hypothetical protein ACIBSV_16285 [Embleya sp. NPDC050154]|uniref:hypothetical protein n=1 Tax=Embleya sp. NPDC050154 TaxID=3363988 RepID=UPI0037A0ECE2
MRDVEVKPFATAGMRDDIETIRASAREHGADEVLLLDDRRHTAPSPSSNPTT